MPNVTCKTYNTAVAFFAVAVLSSVAFTLVMAIAFKHGVL